METGFFRYFFSIVQYRQTKTEMGVSSHTYTVVVLQFIVCASAEHAENDSYLPLISAFLHFQGGV